MALNLSRRYTFNTVFNAAVAFAIAAVPVQLRSAETLGSTSAINTDKTGTLTLNQMTAVQMAVAGRRYAVEGKGYSTHGHITRAAGRLDRWRCRRRRVPEIRPRVHR